MPATDPFLELLISKAASGYDVRATSNYGMASGQFTDPLSPQDLVGVDDERQQRVHEPKSPVGVPYRSSDTIRATGHRLFKSLVHDEISGFFTAGYNQAVEVQRPFRIRLVFDRVPELENQPWEYMYSQMHHMFVSVTPHTPLFRSLPALQPIRALRAPLPLRLLIVTSSPGDSAQLNIEQECEVILNAIHPLKKQSLIESTVLKDPTLHELTKALSESTFHVVHVVAHGEADLKQGKSFLLLQDEMGSTKMISANQFCATLRSSPNTRLVVLNACNTAKSHAGWTGSGMCQSLIQSGIPAVVAMSREISDHAGKLFAESLYAAIVKGETIEVATNRARLAVYTDRPEALEWATPVLYMRSASGELFELEPPARKGFFKRLFPRHSTDLREST